MRFCSMIVGALLVCFAGCGRSKSSRSDPVPEPPVSELAPAEEEVAEAPPEPVDLGPKRPLNVLLILIDGLRADMPWTGYPRDIAPRLTAFEKESVSYSRAYSISCMTARSVGPMLAGAYPSEMLRNGYFFTLWLPDNVMLAERLADAGHLTLAVHAHGYFRPGSGVSQGFEETQMVIGTPVNRLGTLDTLSSQKLTEAAIELLGRREIGKRPDAKRFFLSMQYMDPHAPYVIHPDRPFHGSQSRDLYDQEVHYTDEWVGKLIDWVKEQPWADETAIIVSADHGEAFGEHKSYFEHGYFLYEVTTRVPLLVRIPGVPPARIDAARSHIDLARTLLELLGVPPAPEMRGKSLVPEILGQQAAEEREVVLDLPYTDQTPRRRALIRGKFKLIVTETEPAAELFDLEQDPAEQRNLAAERTDVVAEMLARHKALQAEAPDYPAPRRSARQY
jgi:choline-sulfatase